MNSDEKLLISKVGDLFRLCDKYAAAQFSDFLDGAELATVREKAVIPYDYNVMFYGGFDEAEKMIMGVFPQWCEAEAGEFPIGCIKVTGGYTRKLTHRDYLGTIMSLGIAPQKLGDIVAYDDFAYVLLQSDVVGYVADNLKKIGNQGVKTEIIDSCSGIKIERRYKTIGTVCAAPRLDAVVGAAANISRAKSAALIDGGKIKVNHRVTEKTSETVKEGDLLSIRGFGRFLVYSFDGETRKNRLHITFKQYI